MPYFTYFLLSVAVLSIYIIYRAYSSFSKRISITHSDHTTIGQITYSEYQLVKAHSNTHYDALVTYKYYVDKKLYTGKFHKKSFQHNLNHYNFVNRHPTGENVSIYYSPDNIEFSKMDKPPTKQSVFFEVFKYNAIIWVISFTIISCIFLVFLQP